ncbi:MAG: hypothetical protein KKH72_06065 [Alphaproteobacteria bacterium]|nr:hypothetical protein [Alphaproteobacteria bacterium]
MPKGGKRTSRLAVRSAWIFENCGVAQSLGDDIAARGAAVKTLSGQKLSSWRRAETGQEILAIR